LDSEVRCCEVRVNIGSILRRRRALIMLDGS
jgi:hypothetical protein